MPEEQDHVVRPVGGDIARFEGQLEILKSQVSSLQEKEDSGVRFVRWMTTVFFFILAAFLGVSFFNAYQVSEVERKTTERIVDLIDDTKQEIRFITGQARPFSASIQRANPGNSEELTGLLSLELPTFGSDAYFLRMTFPVEVSVEEYPGKFLGFYRGTSGSITEWLSYGGNFATNLTQAEDLAPYREYSLGILQKGTMDYLSPGAFGDVVLTISPSAPLNGNFSFKVQYDTCAEAIEIIDKILNHYEEVGEFGTVRVSPIIENFPVTTPREFQVEVVATPSLFRGCIETATVEPEVIVVDDYEAPDL